MDHCLKILLLLFAVLVAFSTVTVEAPLFGLSTSLSISVLGSSVLGSSSMLGSSVLGSSVLGSSVLANAAIIQAYSGAIVTSQFWISLTLIGMLVYIEVSDPTYGTSRKRLAEMRKSWLPTSALLALLFFIVVALRVYSTIKP